MTTKNELDLIASEIEKSVLSMTSKEVEEEINNLGGDAETSASEVRS